MSIEKESSQGKPVSRVSLGEVVKERVIQYVRENNLKPGDSLPREADFCEMIGVSRTAVREGLKKLQVLGIVESKPKVGMVVANADLESIFQMIAFSMSSSRSKLEDLFDTRYVIETSMADLLNLHISADEITGLERCVREMRDASTFEESLVCDRDFHILLYRATHNTFISSMIPLLKVFFEDIYRVEDHASGLSSIRGYKELVIREHEGVIQSLMDRDGVKLNRFMTEHLKHSWLAQREPYRSSDHIVLGEDK
jgi:GntR family transcriptional regulator, transcriptional repressor for pyruvate dehydrogenase complex